MSIILLHPGEQNGALKENQDSAKECSNYCTIALISHASKVMLKILQARFQHKASEIPAELF